MLYVFLLHGANLPKNVQALDFALDVQPGYGEVVLHRILGCAGSCSTASISDFAPVDEVLPLGVKRRVASVGGRSSTSAMPFFNLEIPENRGVVVAIGWTGQWAAEFERPYFDKDSKLTVRAGMERTHLKLLPGEQIRTPQSLLLFWEGDWIDGQNQFRRFVLRHKTPQVDGKPVQLPIAGMGWFAFGMGNEYSEANQIAFAQLYKKLGLDVETFWVDAGWFEGGWPKGVGNWFPKKEAFPNGFKKLSEVVHGLGMKFLVWFEPERVSAGTWLHREHPEWLLSHEKGGWDFMHADVQRRRPVFVEPGQSRSKGVAYRPHLDVHRGKQDRHLSPRRQHRPFELLGVGRRSRPAGHHRDTPHRRALCLLGGLEGAPPGAAGGVLQQRQPALRFGDDKPNH